MTTVYFSIFIFFKFKIDPKKNYVSLLNASKKLVFVLTAVFQRKKTSCKFRRVLNTPLYNISIKYLVVHSEHILLLRYLFVAFCKM